MSSSPWKCLPVDAPAEDQECWVQIGCACSCPPVLATWDMSGEGAWLTALGLVPWYEGRRWKPS